MDGHVPGELPRRFIAINLSAQSIAVGSLGILGELARCLAVVVKGRDIGSNMTLYMVGKIARTYHMKKAIVMCSLARLIAIGKSGKSGRNVHSRVE